MHQRSSISLSKFLLSRHHFQRSPKPISPFSSKHLSSLANQSFSHHLFHPKPQKTPFFLHPKSSITSTQFTFFNNLRHYNADTDKEVDEINLKFAEAREEIDAAMESKETVYFNEEAECARVAVKEVLDLYQGLLQKLPENERGVIQRSMGLKIEQLKAELQQLND